MASLFPAAYGAMLGNFPGVALGGTAYTITQLLAALSPAAVVPAGATASLIQAEGSDVRWRDDGMAPTTTLGFLLQALTAPEAFSGAQFKAMQLISTGASTLNLGFYK
jgi:hypothetical protein